MRIFEVGIGINCWKLGAGEKQPGKDSEEAAGERKVPTRQGPQGGHSCEGSGGQHL
jgi:hypothetical protein